MLFLVDKLRLFNIFIDYFIITILPRKTQAQICIVIRINLSEKICRSIKKITLGSVSSTEISAPFMAGFTRITSYKWARLEK